MISIWRFLCRRRFSLALVIALLICWQLADRWLSEIASTPSLSTEPLAAPGPLLKPSQSLALLHETKRAARSGEWLDTHFEVGQTFAEYLRSKPNGPTRIQNKIYLQPLGRFSDTQQQLITSTGDLLSRYYGLPVLLQTPIELSQVPPFAQRVRHGERQLLTSYLRNDVLVPARPVDAVAVLGLTTTDLWPGEGWNFLFGEASLVDRVGVWSLHRYGNPDGDEQQLQAYRQRTFKVALHETGHMLGMQHCVHYECLMNGSNHLQEMDSRPFWLCPECVRKVWWRCQIDPKTRYESLRDFADEHQMPNEAAMWSRSIARLDR